MTSNKTEKNFEQLFCSLFNYHYDIRTVFSDFISMILCTLAMNPETCQSYYEEDYLKAIEPYKAKNDVKHFSILYAKLIMEMDERVGSGLGNDVLGEFFETHIASDRKAQFFTPWPICEFMARINSVDTETNDTLRVIDPCCGSGRMLLAGSKVLGRHNAYYGIDIDLLCVRITVINLFLNGVFNGEIMCADALFPKSSFVESYVLSFIPFRIFKITNKEESPLWQNQVQSFTNKSNMKEDFIVSTKKSHVNGSQLKFF